ncbi:hypothetical protein ACTL6U_04680 [Rhodovibrionaceae bacterium A322]
MSFVLLTGQPALADQSERNEVLTGSSSFSGLSLFGTSSTPKLERKKPDTPLVMRTLQLATVMATGGDPLEGDVTYTFQGLGGLNASKEVVATQGKSPRVALPEGRYLLQTSYNAATVQEEILIDANSEQHVVNLGAGEITLRMIPKIGAKAFLANMTWTILSYGKDQDGNRQVLHQSGEGVPRMILPAGWYMVHAMHKDHLVKHVIDVGEGQVYNYTLLRQ